MTGQIERRHQQRLTLQLLLWTMSPSARSSATYVTRDVSSRGVYFWADIWDEEVETIEFCTVLPGQVTMGNPVLAKCSATILRVERDKFSKIGVAATINGWTVM